MRESATRWIDASDFSPLVDILAEVDRFSPPSPQSWDLAMEPTLAMALMLPPLVGSLAMALIFCHDFSVPVRSHLFFTRKLKRGQNPQDSDNLIICYHLLRGIFATAILYWTCA
mmetsp:Transcript_23744/g.42849  ORF Transcript_23744/g.42849 Transcript_23744/m.42849 type:complete len:114 (+) Transcript_23744:144-485(+)